MDNWLKFPGKVYLSAPRCLKLVPVFRSEVIGAAAAPVHNVFILALKTNVLLNFKQIRMLNIDLRLLSNYSSILVFQYKIPLV